MRCDERRDPILLWVMGQLESGEEVALREHVQSGCTECAGYVAEARELQLGLLLAPDPAEPAPKLERMLLERVAGDGASPRPPPPRAGMPWRWAAAAALAAVTAAAVGYRVGEGEPRPAAAATTGLAEELGLARVQLGEADEELGELEARLHELETLLEESSEQVELLRAPDVQRVQLAGTSAQPRASASIFWQWGSGYYCYLHALGLPQPEGDGVYALWMENEAGERILVGTFRPDSTGVGVVWARLPAEAGRAAGALVTLEPGEPGPEPRGAIQLVSS